VDSAACPRFSHTARFLKNEIVLNVEIVALKLRTFRFLADENIHPVLAIPAVTVLPVNSLRNIEPW